jgi:hypothetical protein
MTCDCQYKLCLIERGVILFYDKEARCKQGGGQRAIISNNKPDFFTDPWLGEIGHIPYIFISQKDGLYHLLNNSLGQLGQVSVSQQPTMLELGVLRMETLCLREGW